MRNKKLNKQMLLSIISKSINIEVIDANYTEIQLRGGTLGDVRLVSGICKTTTGEEQEYRLVLKSQKRWARPGDPDSWRREYDIYNSDFEKVFSDTIKMPKCYYSEKSEEEVNLWLEYIEGVSSDKLTIEMLEIVTSELANLQGKLFVNPNILQNILCFSDTGYFQREFEQWHTKAYEYDYLSSEKCRLPDPIKEMTKNITWNNEKSLEYNLLRSDLCKIPLHLKEMIYDIDNNKDGVFENLKKLPIVVCHRDFWQENIFVSSTETILIDWDGVGFGFLGEDIISLIIDDTPTERLKEYLKKLIPVYYNEFAKLANISIDNKYIAEMMLIKFGYRIVQNYLFTELEEVKIDMVNRLQFVFDLKEEILLERGVN